jgi:hypothetical protein
MNQAGDILNAIGQATPIAGPSPCPRNDSQIKPVTVVIELGPDSLRVLAEVQADLRRIADHFDPPPSEIVDTPYIAERLGVTTTRIAQMVREGTIPKGCIVRGSGNGRLWKFHRRQLEDWLAKRG